MKANQSKIIKGTRFIALLPLLWLVFLAFMNSFNPSVKDPELTLIRPDVPAGSNAFWTLLKATNELYWPDKQWKKLDDLSSNTNWDSLFAANVLAKNTNSLKLLDEAMKQPFLLIPEPKTFEDDASYLAGWRNLAQVESIQINSLHRAKKDKEAFALAFKILNFAQRAENSGGPILNYLVGSAIKNVGVLRIRQMIADTTLNDTNLAQTIRELDDFGPNKAGLTNAIKTEFKIQCNYIDNFAHGQIPDTTNSAFGRVIKAIYIRPLLSPRKTKLEFASSSHFILDNLSKPLGEIRWSDSPGSTTNMSSFISLLGGNLLGEITFDALGPITPVISKAKSKENVNVTATQLLLALKVYKMHHGKLPDSLSELTPEFFPQVPLDNFDGKPFRYLPAEKIIYSVGPCLKALGGKAREGHSDDYNLPFKIEF